MGDDIRPIEQESRDHEEDANAESTLGGSDSIHAVMFAPETAPTWMINIPSTSIARIASK
jgi:hypothetical protein